MTNMVIVTPLIGLDVYSVLPALHHHPETKGELTTLPDNLPEFFVVLVCVCLSFTSNLSTPISTIFLLGLGSGLVHHVLYTLP